LARAGTATAKLDKITEFAARSEVRPNSAEFSVFDPARPQAPLTSRDATTDLLSDALSAVAGATPAAVAATVASAARAIPGTASVAVAAATAADALLGGSPLEIYEHHANYLFPEWNWLKEEPGLILRQKRRRARGGGGESGCPGLTPGHVFALDDHPLGRFNRSWVVTAVRHEGYATAPENVAEWQVYRNRFECAPAEVTFCPPRPKQRSVVAALTATVVGPPGEEIHTDAQGRIKVHFHWDRSGRRADASCWIRTMQSWGGANWGAQFIPRVGMEVVVAFDGGDPDKPIVLGCLYNGTHPTTFPPVSDKTRSGFRTSSSPGGQGFNELSFEDAAGKEQIYVHAQRDLDEVIERDHTRHVKRDTVTHVDGNRKTTVSGDASNVVRGKREEHVVGDASSQVDGNRIDVVIGTEDRRVSGHRALRLESCDQSLLVDEPYEIEGADGADNIKGRTDADGRVVAAVPVRQRELRVVFPKRNRAHRVQIGDMDPLGERSGVCKRLQNLGILSPGDEHDDDAVTIGIARFQESEGLSATGSIDDATLAALEKAHGQ